MASPRQWRDRLQPHPHLEDGSAYRQLRPTRLDEIKNFHAETPVGPVAKPTSLSYPRCKRTRQSNVLVRAHIPQLLGSRMLWFTSVNQ